MKIFTDKIVVTNYSKSLPLDISERLGLFAKTVIEYNDEYK
jgi:hypothetical protein